MLASGGAGATVAEALRRLMPREDLVLLADHAYAPYGRRRGHVVADRVARLAADVVALEGAKLVVVASAQGTLDALAAVEARAGVPAVGFEPPLRHAAVHARGGTVAVVVGHGCVRGRPYVEALRRRRTGATARVEAWPGLRELVEGGVDGDRARRLVEARALPLREAGVAAVALGCPHASAVGRLVAAALGPGIPVLDGAPLVAERARVALRRRGLLVHGRRRAGQTVLLSSDPVRGRALAGAVPRLRGRAPG